MNRIKPQPGVCIDKAHPLAQGLVQCWLLNEGAGETLHDCARGEIASGDPAPTWAPDRCDFNGTDQVCIADLPIDGEQPFSIVMQIQVDLVPSERIAVGFGHPTYHSRLSFGCLSGGRYRLLLREDDNSNVVNAYPDSDFDDGVLHQFAFVFDPVANHFHCYVDGAAFYDGTPYAYSAIHFSRIAIGAEYYDDSLGKYWPGSIYHVYIYDRALTAEEVGQLWREPYVMFGDMSSTIAALDAGPVYDLIGSVATTTNCGATARVMRGLAGESSVTSQAGASLGQTETVSLATVTYVVSTLSGTLQLASEVVAARSPWRADALFAGMMARAAKLGTTLTSGWFWTRPAGCSVLFRGHALKEVDFNDILCVAGPEEGRITLPTYLPHERDSTHIYVVRRFNGNGQQEKTLGAAVEVAMSVDGELAEPSPNAVLELTARPVAGNRITLWWFYSPLSQAMAPKTFVVQDDTEAILGVVDYVGRRVYSFQTEPLTPGTHLLSVKAVTAAGIEDENAASVSCQIGTGCSPAPTILATEVIS